MERDNDKRLTVRISLQDHKAFKSACARQDKVMSKVILAAVQAFIERSQQLPAAQPDSSGGGK